jgi:hypothetical protein
MAAAFPFAGHSGFLLAKPEASFVSGWVLLAWLSALLPDSQEQRALLEGEACRQQEARQTRGFLFAHQRMDGHTDLGMPAYQESGPMRRQDQERGQGRSTDGLEVRKGWRWFTGVE